MKWVTIVGCLFGQFGEGTLTINFAVKSVKKRTRSSAPKLPRNSSRASIVPYPTADKSESAVIICSASTSLRRQQLFWLLRCQPEQGNLHGPVLATRHRTIRLSTLLDCRSACHYPDD